MTSLRQRMIEDMRIRNFATTTQRSYVHYVAEFAKYFHRTPAELDLEAVRQYQLYLSQQRKLSPQSINTFVSAVQFLDRLRSGAFALEFLDGVLVQAFRQLPFVQGLGRLVVRLL